MFGAQASKKRHLLDGLCDIDGAHRTILENSFENATLPSVNHVPVQAVAGRILHKWFNWLFPLLRRDRPYAICQDILLLFCVIGYIGTVRLASVQISGSKHMSRP